VIADRDSIESAKNSVTARFLFLTLFIVILASRTVNKHLSADAGISAKPSTEPGVQKLLANYQSGFGYKVRPIRTVGTQCDSSE